MCNLLAGRADTTLIAVVCCVVVALIITAIALSFRKSDKRVRYFLKPCLLTPTEKEYLKAIEIAVGDRYIILPQINLASVIDKEGEGFRSELFRNADFGIFDYDYRPVMLIEINDDTHLRKDRAERDEKVSAICKKARLPIVFFWTRDGLDQNEITKTLRKYL